MCIGSQSLLSSFFVSACILVCLILPWMSWAYVCSTCSRESGDLVRSHLGCSCHMYLRKVDFPFLYQVVIDIYRSPRI